MEGMLRFGGMGNNASDECTIPGLVRPIKDKNHISTITPVGNEHCLSTDSGIMAYYVSMCSCHS